MRRSAHVWPAALVLLQFLKNVKGKLAAMDVSAETRLGRAADAVDGNSNVPVRTKEAEELERASSEVRVR